MEARHFSTVGLRHWRTAICGLVACGLSLAHCQFVAAQRFGGRWSQPQGLLMQQPARQHGGPRMEMYARSQNFLVFADDPQWARQVAEAAESYRSELAMRWLGKELPDWSSPCPLHVHANPQAEASGETRFAIQRGQAGGWMMIVRGTRQRVLDSVLPHEITHTIFATHFAPLNKYVPRWADEGACTTVEHEAEKRKHRYFVEQFLMQGRGISFNRMFSLKEYPTDMLPLYAQAHSVVRFLIGQSSPRKFVEFLETAMPNEQWESAIREHYGYKTLGEMQSQWNQWLIDGRPENLIAYAPNLRKGGQPDLRLASNETAPAFEPANGGSDQQASPFRLAIGNTGPAPAQLANQRVVPNAVQQSGRMLSNNSWYRRRLTEVSGGPATRVPSHNNVQEHLPQLQSTARPHTNRARVEQMPNLKLSPEPKMRVLGDLPKLR